MIRFHKLLHTSFTCANCGRRYVKHTFGQGKLYEIAQQKGICLECAKWMIMSKERPENCEVIDGVIYKVCPPTKKSRIITLGGKGKYRCIVHKDGSGMVSNDVWTIGQVPDQYKSLFQNTGWWVNSKYRSQMKYCIQCENKTCFDRYHCFRYDYRQEFDNGPMNTPPDNWIVGNEKCPAFVNIRDIKNYEYYDIKDMLDETQDKQAIGNTASDKRKGRRNFKQKDP